jgi:putative zinc finger/helix-turn-helix YgiT family protein
MNMIQPIRILMSEALSALTAGECTMSKPLEKRRCHLCGQFSLRRVQRPFQYDVSHDGRPPVTIRIPDLEVIACANPDCRPEDPGDNVLHDDAATWRVTVETYRQLGLLTPDEIRAGRERLGLNQQELAELLGLGGNTLSRWENGHYYQARSMDRLLRLVFTVPDALRYCQQQVQLQRNVG